jgi:sugar phosphate isomerase/epimerase
VVAFCGSLGIQGIELNHVYWDDYDPARLKQLAADAGLPIVAYVGFVDLAVPPSARPRALDQAFALLDRTAELGASMASWNVIAPYKEEFSLAQQRAWLIEALPEACERALSMGLIILTENAEYPPSRPLLGRAVDCRDICAQVDSPGFRLIYDVGGPIFQNEDPFETFNAMRPYVAHVHLKNYRAIAPGERPERFRDSDDGRRYTGTTLDRGVSPIERIVAELSRFGYEGFIQIEYQGEEDPRIALKHNVDYLRGILGRLG